MKKVYIKFVLFIINNILKGTHFFKMKNQLLNLTGIKVGVETNIVGPIYFDSNIKLTIGSNCWIGKNLVINGNGEVIIGNNVDIAPNVSFNTGGHKIGNSDRRAGRGIKTKILVGDGTWIGTECTFINNISIGKGVVIGASSLINKDVVDNVLVAGVPARIKKVLKE